MTKSKKLISMLLALVMLVTSCSLSFFAYAADSAEEIQAVEDAAIDAFNDLTNINKGANSAKANTFLTALKGLQDPTSINPVYYAFAFQIVSSKKAAANTAKKKAASLKNIGDGDADETAYYTSLMPVPAKYVAVLKAYNDAFDLVKATNNAINFNTNDTYVTLWSALKTSLAGFDADQLKFADALTINSTNGIYINLTKNSIKECTTEDAVIDQFKGTTDAGDPYVKDAAVVERLESEKGKLLATYGTQLGNKLATIYHLADVRPVKSAQYVSGSSWNAAPNNADGFYSDLMDHYNNADTYTKNFYVNLFTTYGTYSGAKNAVTKVIDAGLKLQKKEDVSFSEVKAAYKAYSALPIEAMVAITTVSDKVNSALFDVSFSDNTVATEYAKGEASFKSYLANAGNAAAATAFEGVKFTDLLANVFTEYFNELPINEYIEYVNGLINGGVANITEANVTKTWEMFNALDTLNQNAIRSNSYKGNEGTWDNTVTVMTSQFVNYVNAVDIDNVTATNVTESTELLEATIDEFKTLLTTSNTFTAVYNKYIDIQIFDFKSYVEGVDLDNVTDEIIETAEAKFNALSDELKAAVKKKKTLYQKYLDILSGAFKSYVNSLDPDNVTDAQREEAKNLYQALSDEAKESAYTDDALWSKYCKIQTPEVDTDKHTEEKNKKADKATLPKNSEAINNLGLEKSVDNVENFLTDDLLPALTDAIEVTDKNDAVNSALKKHLTNANIGKVYALYATLSHNQEEVSAGTKAGDLVKAFISTNKLRDTLAESKFSPAKDKIADAITNGKISKETRTVSVGRWYDPAAYSSVEEAEEAGAVTYTVSELGDKKTYKLEDVKNYDANKTLEKFENTESLKRDDNDGTVTAELPEMIEIGINDEGDRLYEYANNYDGIAVIEYENGDFGFEDGDRDGFEAALLAALRPITGLINLIGSYIGVELGNHVDKNTGEFTLGLYEAVASVLEALGVTGLPTNDEYLQNIQDTIAALISGGADMTSACYIAGDEILRPLLDGVCRFIDSDLKTVGDVVALIPRLGDIIHTDTLYTAYKSLVADLGMLSGLIGDIEVNGMPLAAMLKKDVLPDALLAIINNKLAGIGVKLEMPDWDTLNKYTTFKVNKSAQCDKDYVAVRYIDGDVMFAELVYYLHNNLFANKDNAAALKDKIGGLPLVGSTFKDLIEKAEKGDKYKTFAAILDYFYDNGEDKDATAEAGKSIGEAIESINETLDFSPINASKAKIKVSKRKYAYNGKIQKPSVKVTLNGETLKKGVAYKVTYSNAKSKKIGTYKVTVTFIGAYEGKAKTYTYTIGPKNAKKLKATAKKGAIKLTWKKSGTKAVKGYVIKYSTSKSFKNAKTVKIKSVATTSKTITGLTKGKTYYVKIKSYTEKSGKKLYSTYSKPRTAKVK